MNIENARKLATDLFSSKVDLQNKPYVGHLSRVVDYLPVGVMDEVVMVAWLHDVIEDTEVGRSDLLKMGFSELVVGGVESVSKQKGESYTDFIVRSGKHVIGKLVKVADLMDNSSSDRAIIRKGNEDRDRKRQGKYILSKSYLFGELTEERYRQEMLDLLGE